MTTFAFAPPPNNTFAFQPTLDGQTSTCVVYWNLDAQRWYVNVSVSTTGVLFNMPLIGSASPQQVQYISWANGAVIGHTVSPHGFPVLSTAMLTLAGFQPDAYNGTFECFITDVDEFTYPLSSNPGSATGLGTLGFDVNIGAGFLITSTLVYRPDSQTFEVSP